jgi:HlyD family secretion protein
MNDEPKATSADLPLLPLDEVLRLLSERVIEFLQCERCTIFIHDPVKHELWSRVATGDNVREIRMPESSGFAGACFVRGETLNIPDAYSDPRFNREVDRSTGFMTLNILCAPIRRPDGLRVGVIQALNKRGGLFVRQDEALLDVFSAQAAITLQNALAEEALQAARRNESALAAQLAQNHEQLQQAFHELNGKKQHLEHLMRKQRVLQRLAIAAGVLVALLMAYVLLSPGEPAIAESVAIRRAGEAVVEKRAIESYVTLGGVFEPIQVANLTSPFAGRVRAVMVKPGDRVEERAPLVEIDAMLLDQELRALESRYIEARTRLQDLEAWSTSRDVSVARRHLARSKADLEQARVNASNAQLLFERGVVSHNERQAALAAVANLETQVANAEEELAATLRRGSEDNVRIARNAFANIEQEFNRKQANRERATVRAPFNGVVLQTSAGRGAAAGLTPGRDVSEGELLLVVGQLDGFRVRTTVDETDVTQLRVQQPVIATGSAFPGITLPGRVANIGSHGVTDRGLSRFEVEMEFPEIPAEGRDRVLVGMSCDLRVRVYANPSATVVPLAAVLGSPGRYRVDVLANGQTTPRALELGATGEDGFVEAFSGVQPGETVVVYR